MRRAVEAREDRPRAVRGRGVLARGRLAHRARVPGAGGRSGDRGRRDNHQHSGHGRLYGAGRVRRAVPLPAPARARHRPGHALGALPRRSGHGGRQQPDGRGRRRAADRVHDQRHRRARRQLLARGSGDGADTRARPSSTCRPACRPRACIRPAAWSRASPACRFRATRQWSARTPSRTSRASTSTACSRTTRPTRSCGPRMWACRAATSCSASTAAATRSASASSELGFELDELELNRVFEEFKALADRKKELFDGDIEALVLRAEGHAAGSLGARARCGSKPRAARRRAPAYGCGTRTAAA